MAWIAKEEYQTVGRNLAAARKRAGVTQDELAALLRKPQSFVSDCETGQRRIDLLELARIASALRIDPRDLLAVLLP